MTENNIDNNNNNNNNNISFSFEENDENNDFEETKLQDILNEFNDIEYMPTQYPLNVFNNYDFDQKVSQTVNYNVNYTVKQLMDICEYYGLAKEVKTCKLNKEQIIDTIINYEFDPENDEIVVKRKMMWYYIKELKNDKIMKKYIIWGNK